METYSILVKDASLPSINPLNFREKPTLHKCIRKWHEKLIQKFKKFIKI